MGGWGIARALRARLHVREVGGEAGGGEELDEADAGVEALLLLLESSMELWRTQRGLLGPLHPECAVTMHDIGHALGALLARAPRALFARHAGVWDSPHTAGHAERRALELHAQIAALYDTRSLGGADPIR